MTPSPLLLVGAGGHARACIDVIEQHGGFAIAGLVGSAGEVGTWMLGYPVIGTDDDLPTLLGAYESAVVTVGQIKSPEARIRLFSLLERHGMKLPVIASPRSYVSRHASLGAGTMVLHDAVVNAGAIVGRNCIVNSRALVEHDVVIGDHCHIATAAVVNGSVRVGAGTFIGSNATIRQSVNIGDRCVIGMGQRVLADCEPGARVPALRQPT